MSEWARTLASVSLGAVIGVVGTIYSIERRIAHDDRVRFHAEKREIYESYLSEISSAVFVLDASVLDDDDLKIDTDRLRKAEAALDDMGMVAPFEIYTQAVALYGSVRGAQIEGKPVDSFLQRHTELHLAMRRDLGVN